MTFHDLEHTIEKLEEDKNKPLSWQKRKLRSLKQGYELFHEKHPFLTNYLSTAIGTVGGDFIAKQFTQNHTYTPRDLAFTASAAVAFTYLIPKMLEWSTDATNKAAKGWNKLDKSEIGKTLLNTGLLTIMYMPINMVYWNYLTIKNQEPITLENNLDGLAITLLASIPYLVVDYFVVKHLSKEKDKKWLRPIYGGAEIVWNTLFAGGNYFAKKN